MKCTQKLTLSIAGCLLLILATPGSATADDRNAKNSIFAEGLGPGLLYSINYERMIIDDLGVRLGFSYMKWSASAGEASADSHFVVVPLTVNYIGIGNGKHALELGAGVNLEYTSAEASSMGVSASGSGVSASGNFHMGYRIQPLDGGFQFRIGLGGIYGPGYGVLFGSDNPTSWGVLPWGYISFGGTF